MNPLNILIIHGSFISANIIYFICYQFLLEVPDPVPLNMPVTLVLAAVALFQIPMGFFIPAIIARSQPPGLLKAQTRMIVSNAFFGAIAVYGMIGEFVGMPAMASYAFMGLSTLLLLVNTVFVLKWMNES